MSSSESTQSFFIEDIERFSNRYSLGSERGENSKHFLRIKIPNGILTAQQFREIAQLAKKYSKEYAEVTDRHAIQLHWIESEDAPSIFAQLEKLGFTTDRCGQGFPGARYGDVRGIVGCPTAGVHQSELINTAPIVKELDKFFTGNKDFQDMPKKFKISVSACPLNCTNPMVHDLSFVAMKHPSGRIGFSVVVGGTVGKTAKLAESLDVFVEPQDVVNIARAAAEIYRDYGQRDNKAKSRFRWLLEEWGTVKLKRKIEEKIGKKLETYKPEKLPMNKGEHIGVNTQKQKGLFYVSIPLLGGILSTDLMLKIAEIAEKYGSGDLRLSPAQNIVIINIPKERVDAVVKQLEDMGFPMKGSALRWTTIACAGNFCGKAPEYPKKRATEMIAYLEERLGEKLKDLDLRICLSGCPNGCARHLIADIGLQATLAIVEGKPTPAYNIYVASSGTTPSLGRLIKRNVRAEEVKYEVEKLIVIYIKNKNSLRSLHDFYNKPFATRFDKKR